MKVLIIGSGGREHALAWKSAQSTQVTQVFVAPGNAGSATEAKVTNVAIPAEDIPALLQFAQAEKIDLTIVGPEAPLVAGIVDAFQAQGLACFGPSQKAAQLEASKTFTKDFLKRHNIPSAAYESFTEVAPAIAYVKQQSLPIVIKADGLAAGKGVVIAQTYDEAVTTIEQMLGAQQFGEASARIVIESFLTGEECSFIVLCDGKNILPMATSQDHKARDEGDTGPNTGGMGAYSPAPLADDALTQRIMDTVIEPTVAAMAQEGAPYTGFLYAGLMVNAQGEPYVLEYNCRFGDPETQPILMRLQSDLPALCLAALNGTLDQMQTQWDPRTALGVVMASRDYPNSYPKGEVIKGLDQHSADVKVFHAGTAQKADDIVTQGGRVLCVTALGKNIAKAQQAAYAHTQKISWPSSFYRKDIGDKGLKYDSGI